MPDPVSLYIHVPFCCRKCDYCAFYSIDNHSAALRRSYLTRLNEEMATIAHASPLQTIFIGGGTPTSLDVEELDQLLATVHRHFLLDDDCEFTIEVNPESMAKEKAALLSERGVTRLSMGAQSYDSGLREQIGRRGSINHIEEAVGMIRDAGIRNINMDLIYALPGQSMQQWQEDLNRVLGLEPQHLSTYSLSIEEGTPLAERCPSLPDDETSVAMWHAASDKLEHAQLHRYEISNFALPGHECRHNVGIWYGQTFLGAGPAAHWFDGTSRWSNPADLHAWLDGAPPIEDALPPEDRAVEILITGLRVLAGWNRERFHTVTGFDYVELRGDVLRQLTGDGLLTMQNDELRATEDGLLLSDHVARELI